MRVDLRQIKYNTLPRGYKLIRRRSNQSICFLRVRSSKKGMKIWRVRTKVWISINLATFFPSLSTQLYSSNVKDIFSLGRHSCFYFILNIFLNHCKLSLITKMRAGLKYTNSGFVSLHHSFLLMLR